MGCYFVCYRLSSREKEVGGVRFLRRRCALVWGRWSSPGVPVVYTVGALSLTQLEILVHLPTERLLQSYVAFQAVVPGACIDVYSQEELPYLGTQIHHVRP